MAVRQTMHQAMIKQYVYIYVYIYTYVCIHISILYTKNAGLISGEGNNIKSRLLLQGPRAEESGEFFRCWQLQAIPRWQAIDQLDPLDPLDTGLFSSVRKGV